MRVRKQRWYHEREMYAAVMMVLSAVMMATCLAIAIVAWELKREQVVPGPGRELRVESQEPESAEG